jgi:lycopene cyclase domain-containing protein
MIALVLSGAAPLILSFYPPLGFYRHKKALAAAILLEAVIFAAWDVFAVARGHWRFDPSSVSPFSLINLPLEEVLFFFVIPFNCVFVWEVMGFFGRRRP